MKMEKDLGCFNVRPLGEFDINDLYNLIMDENDKGNEVVALVVDYKKRIRHAERANGKKQSLRIFPMILKRLQNILTFLLLHHNSLIYHLLQ